MNDEDDGGLPTAAIVNGNEAGHFLVWQDYGYESSDVGDELVRRSDVQEYFELKELIDQLAFTHRGLQQLKNAGIDEFNELDEKIESNQRLQSKLEELLEELEQ